MNLIRTLSFGPFLVLAFLLGAFVFWKKGKEEYYDLPVLFDIFMATCFWALVGARLGFIVIHFSSFGVDVLKWLSLYTYPGYLGISGMVVGSVVLFMLAKKAKLDVYEVTDFAALSLCLALVIVFLGMFVNGSGFGNSTTLPIGLPFPGVFDKRHPTQLYAAFLYFALFVVLWKLERVYRTFLWYRANRRTAQTGFVTAVFCIGYGLIGMFLAFVQPSFISVYGVHVEALLRWMVMVFGMGLLYVRSGRSLAVWQKKQAEKKEEKQEEKPEEKSEEKQALHESTE